MRLDFKAQPVDEPEVRLGIIGCGSHMLRNMMPLLPFVPARLVAAVDLEEEKARWFAERFGGGRAFTRYEDMLEQKQPDAVLVVVGNDERGRPLYPPVAERCMRAGCDVLLEKPPAATSEEIRMLMDTQRDTGRIAMVAYKKMFVQAFCKARELARTEDFGGISMVTVQNPEILPSPEALRRFLTDGLYDEEVAMFMEHVCHPVSQLVSLLGVPERMWHDRNEAGAGVAVFHFPGDVIATLHFSCGQSLNGGVERMVITSRSGREGGGRSGGRHIVMDNNLRLTYHRNPDFGYGNETDFYRGTPDQNTAEWMPEFSRGQMFNNGLFLQGYYGELAAFTQAVLERRQPRDGTLEQAYWITRVFEAFLEGPMTPVSFTPSRC